MSDYRSYQDPNDPTRRPVQNLPQDDAMASNATWGWVAAAIFAVVVLFLAFTAGRDDSQTTATRDTTPPATSGSATNSPTSRPAMPANPSANPSTNPSTNGAR